MRQINFPNWLVWIDENLKWLSIPKLPLILTIIQVFGFFLAKGKPIFIDRLVLYPSDVFHGEIWRIFTFIAIPLASNFLVFFVLWFFYDVMIWLESTWGSMFLTVYFLIAWLSTVFAAFLTNTPVDTFAYMECSFFFALATLNPNKELHLFFILPIAFKWIAFFIAGILLVVPLFLGSYNQQFNLILVFANYLLFFGKD
jgi:hypothetical protein